MGSAARVLFISRQVRDRFLPRTNCICQIIENENAFNLTVFRSRPRCRYVEEGDMHILTAFVMEYSIAPPHCKYLYSKASKISNYHTLRSLWVM